MQEVALLPEASYRLTHLDLFNWGGFAGRHCALIDAEGTAVIGPTGSGKTTLVDALMTLITSNPKYNLASTGGHESDRDLASYVRGLSGPGDGTGSQSHVARPGKAVTGLNATFHNGENSVGLGVILWFDDSSMSPSDMKKLWYFATSSEHSLDVMLEAHQQGGMRALRQREKTEIGLWTFPTKKTYLARVRDFFEVRENAFNLLNRAAGLKQLNSIDDIFRELVLDDTSKFDEAKQVANSFDDLTAIHQELDIARRQKNALEPVKSTWEKCALNHQALGQLEQLDASIPVWFALQGYRLWQQRAAALTQQLHQRQTELDTLASILTREKQNREHLNAAYLRLGGADIETLEKLIADKEIRLGERERNVRDYRQLCQKLALNDLASRDGLEQNQHQLATVQQAYAEQIQQSIERIYQIGADLNNQRTHLADVTNELEAIAQRPGSNIPANFQDFRADLANELGLSAAQLPFLAELVQVKAEQADWRGAVERAMGSQRLRILVPASQLKLGLRWINSRNNRLHVRLWQVAEHEKTAKFFDDSYLKKLDYKEHPYREAAKHLLTKYDLHCVETAEALQHTAHAITVQGMVSGQSGFYDKQDQRKLSADWLTGFDNKDRLAMLTAQHQELTEQKQVLVEAQNRVIAEKDQADQRMELTRRLESLTFSAIDTDTIGAEISLEQQKLSSLTAPASDTAQAKAALATADATVGELDAQRVQLNQSHGKLENQLDSAEAKRSEYYGLQEPGLTEDQQALLEARFADADDLTTANLADRERQAGKSIKDQLTQHRDRQSRLERELTKAMSDAQREDRGALSEAGRELADVPKYLERLTTLTEEALPEKLKRFLDYLNRSSDEGVTQLLASIKNETDRIEERLEDLNSTLRRVDFQADQYLQLICAKVTHESLRTLQKAQKQLNSARLVDDQGESQYKALQQMVALLKDACERSRTVAAKSLLDPRFRLEFKVSVINRTTGVVVQTQSGSQSGSGGEKELFASYVLTASLSYALCPDGSSRPKFGTIVLDEAFSRSSQVVAGRIISALRAFGLHTLFITPNKEMRLLRNHTRSAIVVHRRGLESFLVSMSWHELEQKKPPASGPV